MGNKHMPVPSHIGAIRGKTITIQRIVPDSYYLACEGETLWGVHVLVTENGYFTYERHVRVQAKDELAAALRVTQIANRTILPDEETEYVRDN